VIKSDRLPGVSFKAARFFEPWEKIAMIRFQRTKAILAVGTLLTMSAGIAFAGDDVTTDTIVRALQPKQATRSLSMAPSRDPATVAAEGHFVDSLRNRRTRSLSMTERDEIATIAADKPNIDLEITFDYNSADISASSLPSVQALGRALANPNLKGSTFMVAGHTDAVGGEAYNQDLSERRADTIKRHLVDNFGIASNDLITVGYGKSKLKNPNAPMDPANRRVQVVNLANKTASK
jgi:outer membrane protein OmpA-like peptidoglycan-associated protein